MADRGLVDPRRNRLLAGLEGDELDEIAPWLQHHETTERTQVHEPGSLIEHVYFPLTAVFSLVAGVGEKTIEVSTIGREGMVGLPVFLGSAPARTLLSVRCPARASGCAGRT